MAPYKNELKTLLHCFKHLPESIPLNTGYYGFNQWHDLTADWLDKAGTRQGALNGMLKPVFGSRRDGSVKFEERGEGLEGVVEVLQRELTGTNGENILLTKWVDDLTTAAKEVCDREGHPVSRVVAQLFAPKTHRLTRHARVGTEGEEKSHPHNKTRLDRSGESCQNE